MFGSILNVLNNVRLFGVSLSIFIIGAFIASVVMSVLFDIGNSDSKGKGKGE